MQYYSVFIQLFIHLMNGFCILEIVVTSTSVEFTTCSATNITTSVNNDQGLSVAFTTICISLTTVA